MYKILVNWFAVLIVGVLTVPAYADINCSSKDQECLNIAFNNGSASPVLLTTFKNAPRLLFGCKADLFSADSKIYAGSKQEIGASAIIKTQSDNFCFITSVNVAYKTHLDQVCSYELAMNNSGECYIFNPRGPCSITKQVINKKGPYICNYIINYSS